jgi:hypothetical protein
MRMTGDVPGMILSVGRSQAQVPPSKKPFACYIYWLVDSCVSRPSRNPSVLILVETRIGIREARILPAAFIINIEVMPERRPRRQNDFDSPAFYNLMIYNSMYSVKIFFRQ